MLRYGEAYKQGEQINSKWNGQKGIKKIECEE